VVLGASLCFFLTLLVGTMRRETFGAMVTSQKAIGTAVAVIGALLVVHAVTSGDATASSDSLSLPDTYIQHEAILGVLLALAGGAYFVFGWPLKTT
jgi:hypothetical protein